MDVIGLLTDFLGIAFPVGQVESRRGAAETLKLSRNKLGLDGQARSDERRHLMGTEGQQDAVGGPGDPGPVGPGGPMLGGWPCPDCGRRSSLKERRCTWCGCPRGRTLLEWIGLVVRLVFVGALSLGVLYWVSEALKAPALPVR
jgi:hypothetical protein